MEEKILICPACETELTKKEINGVIVDICENCGGIWFDNYELMKFDEKHEPAGELLEIKPKLEKPIKYGDDDKRACPKCEDAKLRKHYFSYRKKVKIDECPVCGGIWLDNNELNIIRNLFKNAAEHEIEAEKFTNVVIDSNLEHTAFVDRGYFKNLLYYFTKKK